MKTTALLQLLVEIGGIVFLVITFLSYTKRKMTAEIGLLWILFSILIMVVGAIPNCFLLAEQIRKSTAVVLFGAAFFFFLMLLYLSTVISQLLRRNQELAIQVSLLTHDNERILSALDKEKQDMLMRELPTLKETEENNNGIGTAKRTAGNYANV